MTKPFLKTCFISPTNRTINREVCYVHGPKPTLIEHTLRTHFDYDVETDTLFLIRDMSRFDTTRRAVPEEAMGRDFRFVDDNGKVIETNYHTIRYILRNYASLSKKPKSSKPFNKKVFSSFTIPGSSCGFSF